MPSKKYYVFGFEAFKAKCLKPKSFIYNPLKQHSIYIIAYQQ